MDSFFPSEEKRLIPLFFLPYFHMALLLLLYMAICNCSLHCINMPSTNDKEKDKDFLKIMQFKKAPLITYNNLIPFLDQKLKDLFSKWTFSQKNCQKFLKNT